MANTSILSRLKRLFSTDVIIRNVGGNQLKVSDINQIQMSGELETNSLYSRYNRIYTTSPTSLYGYQSAFNYQTLRTQLYSEYDAMDTDAIIASALDILSEESTLKNDMGEVLHIRSSDENIQKILYNLFYDVLNVEFNLSWWIRNMCLHPDTKIALLDGTEASVKEISEKLTTAPDTEIWVYSIQDQTQKVVPGKIRWAGKTRENTQLVRVSLDNNTYLDTTPDHKFLLRSGEYKQAQYLVEGDSLMPFYTQTSIKSRDGIDGYEKVYNPQSSKYNMTHRVVARELGISNVEREKLSGNRYDTHHVDFNKRNNHPNNLKRLLSEEHRNLHSNLAYEQLWQNEEVARKRKESIHRWLTSDKHREQVKARQSGQYQKQFREYNESELHTAHNILRAQSMKKSWDTGKLKAEKLRLGEDCINYITQIIINSGNWVAMGDLAKQLKNDKKFIELVKKDNPEYKKRITSIFYGTKINQLVEDATGMKYYKFVETIHPHITEHIRYKQIAGKYEKPTVLNHKVVKLEWLQDKSDTYCIEVVGPNGENDRHNFAVCTTDSNGNYTRDGVFIANCKYGDFFLKLEISEKFGVYNVIPFSAFNMERQEGFNKENPTAVRFRYDPDGMSAQTYGYFKGPNQDDGRSLFFDNYEIAHFRLLTDINYLPYGRSYIEPARKLFKQYTLMEDAMLVHRIVRAPEKRIFYMNVGGIPPAEVENFMQKAINKMKRTPYIDQTTGEYNLKYNMQNLMEDFYIPVRGNDTATKIDTLGGLQYDGITDVTYLRDKLFAALRIPKAFLGYDEKLQGKATLAAEDIRFGRTVEKIQRIMTSELYKIAFVHLYTQGYRDETLTNFELSLTTPSIIYDQERVALLREKVDLVNSMADSGLFPSDWIYENIFHLSSDQYDEMRNLVLEDKKRNFRLTQVENEGNDPLETGKSYGTPHDIATAYGKGRVYERPGNVPSGYNEDEPRIGRPVERASFIGTQEDPLGKDRLGREAAKTDDQQGYGRDTTAPFAMEHAKRELGKHLRVLDSIEQKKVLLYESEKAAANLLDESQIKEEE